MTHTADILIIGAGMAGASAGHALVHDGADVALLEREAQPGYHSTGRSAALFSETYGPEPIRKLSTASRAFLEHPPEGFASQGLLTPRGQIAAAPAAHTDKVAALVREGRANGADVVWLDEAAIRQAVPIIKPGTFAAAAYEPGAMDIDVHALHQGFLRGLRRAGGRVATDAEVLSIERRARVWQIQTWRGERWQSPVVVNAAGAWADAVAGLAGVRALGVTPHRRTALTVDLPPGVDAHGWPLLADVGETFYFKPDAGRLLLSPADATPVPPQDVQPEIVDVATVIERFMEVTSVTVERPVSTWAGLRNFVADGVPVAGYAPEADGFFWLAGQGGYGIQTAPAMGRACAALVQGRPWPQDLGALGLRPAALSPQRAALKPPAP